MKYLLLLMSGFIAFSLSASELSQNLPLIAQSNSIEIEFSEFSEGKKGAGEAYTGMLLMQKGNFILEAKKFTSGSNKGKYVGSLSKPATSEEQQLDELSAAGIFNLLAKKYHEKARE